MRRWVQSFLLVSSLVLSNTPVESQLLESQWGGSRRFDESNAIGPGAIDETMFVCYWPQWSVEVSAISAVELATGKLIWSRPANLALPASFRIDEGWLQYDTTDGIQVSPHRTEGERTLHLVNIQTGAEVSIPWDADRLSTSDRTRIHRNRCVTNQGAVVNCTDGTIVGDLGPGDHHTFAADGFLYVMSTTLDESKPDQESRHLRRYDIDDMTLLCESEIPIGTPWMLIAAKGDIVIARSHSRSRHSQIICIDLAQQKQLWCMPFPNAVLSSPCVWREDSRLEFTMGTVGSIRPVIVNLSDGSLHPNHEWRDPRLMLAWHYDTTYYPDFVTSNDRLVIGRWQFQRLSCVDLQTGQLLWSHEGVDHLISRLFCQRDQLKDYIVAEAEHGFNIISVATGERRDVTAADLGMKTVEENTRRADDKIREELETLVSRSKTSSWLLEWSPLLGPVIPISLWVLWTLVRWHSPAVVREQKVV